MTPLDHPRTAAASAASRSNRLKRGSAPAPAPCQAESASTSPAAPSLDAARAAVASAPDVRQERVSALKAAMSDATYSIDSRALAAKLLGSSTS